MKKFLFLVCVLMTPLTVSADFSSVKSEESVLSTDTPPDTNTDAFLDRLNGLNKHQETRDRLKKRNKTIKQSTGSRYGRRSAAKVRGRVSANTIESPGASVGGDSGY